MSKFVLRNLLHVRASPAHNIFHLQIHPLSSSLENTQKSLNESSFTVNYLINSCGFTPERAFSAFNYVKFEAPDKPDSVLTFFKNQGFTQLQISQLVKRYPRVLLCQPEKTLLPKLEFLKSKGISGSDIAVMLTRSPGILLRSIENQLIPSFNYLSKFYQSDEKSFAAIKSYPGIILLDFEKYMKANIEMLKEAGVSIRNIGYLFCCQPKAVLMSGNRFRQIVEEVKKMGFNPSRLTFVLAVRVFISTSQSTWDRKIEAYKKWGWSENGSLAAFRKHPLCMTLSEDKINSVMEFLVNRMGWKSSFLAIRPQLLLFSLKKRIVPRCEVYQALLSKALINPCDVSLTKLLMPPEKQFLQDFINSYEEEAPELLKLYREKLDLAN